MRVLIATLLACLSATAGAQIGLPPVRVPALPPVNVPGVLNGLPGTTDAATAQLNTAQLRELRRARIRDLLRRHRDVLEADSHGDPIVRGQVLLLSPDAASLAAVAGAGFTVERESALGGLDTRLLVLRVTGDTARALKRLQGLDPAGRYDFNHLYLESAAQAVAPTPPPAAAADGAAAPPVVARVGLIDSGVDTGHGAFAGSVLHQHGCAGAAVPAPHGTAVASLLVGRTGAFHGAAPGAQLYAADVFCGSPTGGSVDSVADAFAWLVGERVAVINVSLVGPPNRMLESIVRSVVARGFLIVAAVGNDGPAAPPLYPAAWPGVVGVTGIDARGRVLPEAGRGPRVKFAAPGADMAAASTPHGYVLVRGTSFAAPIVAALLAPDLTIPEPAAAARAIEALATRAQRAGTGAPDAAYGYGVVGGELRPPPALVKLRGD